MRSLIFFARFFIIFLRSFESSTFSLFLKSESKGVSQNNKTVINSHADKSQNPFRVICLKVECDEEIAWKLQFNNSWACK